MDQAMKMARLEAQLMALRVITSVMLLAEAGRSDKPAAFLAARKRQVTSVLDNATFQGFDPAHAERLREWAVAATEEIFSSIKVP